MRRVVAAFLLLSAGTKFVAGQANVNAHAAKNPLANDPAAVDAGQTQFVQACAACHGANAEGGRGPNLAESDDVRRMTDNELFNVIRRGIPGTAMPAFPLPENTIWQIATFLRSLSTPAFLISVSGDVRAGGDVYQKQNCASCHMIYGHGGFLGPDLTDIASSRTVKQLRQSLVRPEDRPVPGFEGVTLTTKDGEHIAGIAKNYSDYYIDVLDAAGHLHLLNTEELLSLKFSKHSLMPSYSNLPAQDLQNLMAFLGRQTVRADARPGQKTSHGEEQ